MTFKTVFQIGFHAGSTLAWVSHIENNSIVSAIIIIIIQLVFGYCILSRDIRKNIRWNIRNSNPLFKTFSQELDLRNISTHKYYGKFVFVYCLVATLTIIALGLESKYSEACYSIIYHTSVLYIASTPIRYYTLRVYIINSVTFLILAGIGYIMSNDTIMTICFAFFSIFFARMSISDYITNKK